MNPWMAVAWLLTAGSVIGLAATAGWMLFSHRRGRDRSRGGVEDAAIPGVSYARYQVMERLLSSRDPQFLSAQPGFTARDGARWKRDSVRIFRLYLSQMTRDFAGLHAYARRLVVESHAESPELAAMLVRQQTAFWRSRIALEGRLLLFTLGIGRVDVAPLLAMIEAMRVDLFRMVPSPAPVV
jgi:hypothetical protein